jgi:hypothetical protein
LHDPQHPLHNDLAQIRDTYPQSHGGTTRQRIPYLLYIFLCSESEKRYIPSGELLFMNPSVENYDGIFPRLATKKQPKPNRPRCFHKMKRCGKPKAED